MVPFTLTVLGNGSAVPTSFQNPTSQLLNYNGKRFLIDCGEGTQMQMIKYNTGHKNIDNIFISHLHGDHFFGLIGLLNTFHLFGRTKSLTVYAPEKIKEIIEIQLKAANTKLRYEIKYVFTDKTEDVLYEDNNITVQHFPLKHSIPTYGFIFREKPKERKLKKSFVTQYSPSIEQIHKIKNGADFVTSDGVVLPNRDITYDPPLSRSYAFCSDTMYYEEVIPYIKGVSLLYHEATFDNSQQELAKEKLHSTAADAAVIALKAGAGRLLLGHYSARLKENEREHLLEEAKEIFPDSVLSEEGKTYFIE